MTEGAGMNWYGLNWSDLFLNVLAIALIPGILAAYGGHIAAESLPGKRKFRQIAFWTLFAIFVGVTFWQQFRAAEADRVKEASEGWIDSLESRALFPPPAIPPYPIDQPPIQTPRPDIGMEIVNPGDVGFRMVNLSNKAVLRDPKYGFALQDLDAPSLFNSSDLRIVAKEADVGHKVRIGSSWSCFCRPRIELLASTD
jgi:hypothetical protein